MLGTGYTLRSQQTFSTYLCTLTHGFQSKGSSFLVYQAWALQRTILKKLVEIQNVECLSYGSADNSLHLTSAGTRHTDDILACAGVLILLQHPPVYTLGAGSTEEHMKFDPASATVPVYRTERGGEVTYHGPG